MFEEQNKNNKNKQRQIQIRNILQYSFFTTLRDFINNVSSLEKTLYKGGYFDNLHSWMKN